MSDIVQIDCPQCQQSLRVRPEYAGKRVACKHCEAVFTIEIPPTNEANEIATDRLEGLKRELEQALNELQIVRGHLDAKDEKLDSVSKALEAALETNRTLQAQFASQASELAEARSHRRIDQEAASRDRSALEAKIAELSADSAERDRIKEANEALKGELQLTQNRLAALQAEYDQNRSELAEKEARCVQFSESHQEVENRLRATEDRESGLHAALGESQSLARTLEAQIDVLKTETAEAQRQRDDQASRAESLAIAIQELQSRLDDSKLAHDASRQDWESRQAALQNERDEWIAKASEASPVLASKEAEIKRLRDELAAFPALVEELRLSLESAKSSEKLAKSHLHQLGIRLPN